MFEAAEIRAQVTGGAVPGGDLTRGELWVRERRLGTLPRSALDLEGGWVNYHRPKTGIGRRYPLWPETVAALNDALTARPDPKSPEDAGLVFLTARGVSWHKANREDRTISKETRKLVEALGLTGSKNFCALRHTFETIGGGQGPGRGGPHRGPRTRRRGRCASRAYQRLKAVSDFVRNWLFGEERRAPVTPNHT